MEGDPAGGADEFGAEGNDQGPIVNKNPYFLVTTLHTVVAFFESYGWYILFSAILLMVVWTNIRDSLKKLIGSRKKEHSVTDLMSSEQVEARMRSMDKARQHMQEKYDALVKEKAEKLKRQEEEKRLQKIRDHEALKQGQSQSGTLQKMEIKTDSDQPSTAIKSKKNTTTPLRPNDFNPLTGSSSTARFRPAASRPSRGG